MTGDFQLKLPPYTPIPMDFQGQFDHYKYQKLLMMTDRDTQIILGDVTMHHTHNPSRQKANGCLPVVGGAGNGKPLMDAEGRAIEWRKGLGMRWGRGLPHYAIPNATESFAFKG